MFAPTNTWRKWHRKININQKRFAVCSAIAATGIPALVMSKGHIINDVSEVPLVVADSVQNFTRTKQAVGLLKSLKAWKDVEKVYKSKRLRAGKGKMRNRRKKQKLGPLIVYSKDNGLTRAFRNIPGIDMLNVNKLNLLRVAPGGHLGRFTIWTESSIAKLDSLYGNYAQKSKKKLDYNLPKSVMTTTDLTRLLKSEEIQRAIRAPMKTIKRYHQKKNPLKNTRVMLRLNPYAAVMKRANVRAYEQAKAKRVERFNKLRGIKVEETPETKRRKARHAAKLKVLKAKAPKLKAKAKAAKGKKAAAIKKVQADKAAAEKKLAEKKAKAKAARIEKMKKARTQGVQIVKAPNKGKKARLFAAKKTKVAKKSAPKKTKA